MFKHKNVELSVKHERTGIAYVERRLKQVVAAAAAAAASPQGFNFIVKFHLVFIADQGASDA